jgi:GT2 family glycosyltransferase
MDDDAIAAPNWAAELLNAYAAFGPSAMIVGGRVDPIWSEPRPAWLPDEKLGNLSVVNWGGEARIAEPREWVAGTNISFRVEAILQYGGFARNLGRIGSGASLLSNEETHLVEKIRAAGGLLIYAPEASVRHLVDERRLSPTWFIKRSAWQAISDFMMSPDTQVAQAENRWRNVTHYFNRLPPHLRTVRGLMTENEDPEMFEAQMGAVYELTVLMLSGFEGVKLD